MEILPKLTRFRINGLEISSFYTLDNVLDKEKENIFQTPQGTVPRGYFTEDGAFQADDLQVGEIGKISRYFSEYGSFQAHDLVEKVVEFQFPLDDEDQGFIDDLKC